MACPTLAGNKPKVRDVLHGLPRNSMKVRDVFDGLTFWAQPVYVADYFSCAILLLVENTTKYFSQGVRSTIFCCFSMFFNDFCRKDWFPSPLLSRPLFQSTDFPPGTPPPRGEAPPLERLARIWIECLSIKVSWVLERWVLNPINEFKLLKIMQKPTKKQLKSIQIHRNPFKSIRGARFARAPIVF